VAIFARLRIIYLQKWDDQFQSEAMMESAMVEWGIGLSGLSGGQVKRAIDEARVRCSWPPSIAEFVGFAKGGDCGGHQGAAYRPFVALPRPAANPAVAKVGIESMRAMLRG